MKLPRRLFFCLSVAALFLGATFSALAVDDDSSAAPLATPELKIGDTVMCEGDVLFQSVPHNLLADTIEACTESPFSHCGILARTRGRWVVIEATPPISKETAFEQFAKRSRDHKVHVYRFKEEHRPRIGAFVAAARKELGRPYDRHFQMDDKNLYCSELIWKAWTASGGKEPLGKPEKLGNMNWKSKEKEIRQIEGGPVPLEREIISPKAVSEADQMEKVGMVEVKAQK